MGVGKVQRAAFKVDTSAAPAFEDCGNARSLRGGRGRAAALHRRTVARQIDVRGDEADAPSLHVSALHRAPCIKADDELGGSQEHVRAPRLTELDAREHRLRAIPSPAQSEFLEAQ